MGATRYTATAPGPPRTGPGQGRDFPAKNEGEPQERGAPFHVCHQFDERVQEGPATSGLRMEDGAQQPHRTVRPLASDFANDVIARRVLPQPRLVLHSLCFYQRLLKCVSCGRDAQLVT